MNMIGAVGIGAAGWVFDFNSILSGFFDMIFSL